VFRLNDCTPAESRSLAGALANRAHAALGMLSSVLTLDLVPRALEKNSKYTETYNPRRYLSVMAGWRRGVPALTVEQLHIWQPGSLDCIRRGARDTPFVIMHQDALAADYQEEEYRLIGMAKKFAWHLGQRSPPTRKESRDC
jgi:hypothetical protein